MPRMFWIGLVATLGCQASDAAKPTGNAPAPSATVTPKYTSDITKLCNVLTLSKADADPGGQLVIVANWLAANLETTESHDFLVSIAELAGEPKAQALDAEAHKVGLPSCALSAAWRKPHGG